MLRELVALEPGKPVLREYEDRAPGSDEVRVKVLYGAPKHGTEMQEFMGIDPFLSNRFDNEYQLFLEDAAAKNKPFGMKLGNMWVGVIADMGKNVSGFKEGDRVAGYGHLRNTHTVKAADVLKMNARMTWKEAVCYDPAHFALGGIRDGNIRLGDCVAVFGLGAIGMIAAQMAKLAGASMVIALDPIEIRRKAALENGADAALDPSAIDAGLELKKLSGRTGMDVILETSGSYIALHQAIRGIAYEGNIAVTGWYKECHGGINLGREAHFNQPNIIMSRAVSSPNRDYPRWDYGRIIKTCWDMLSAGLFKCENIVNPVVPFDKAPETYKTIETNPELSVKMGVDFSA